MVRRLFTASRFADLPAGGPLLARSLARIGARPRKVSALPEARVTVKGQTFDAEMPNFRLTDREIAAALTYVRSAWSNNAPPVEESFVAGIRARYGDRGPWTPYELLAQHPVTEPPP